MDHPYVVIGKFQRQWQTLELRPVVVTERLKERSVRGSEAGTPRFRALRLMGEKESMFVISKHGLALTLPHYAENARSIRTPRHQISHEHDALTGRWADLLQKLPQLARASMHVTYPYGTGHWENLVHCSSGIEPKMQEN